MRFLKRKQDVDGSKELNFIIAQGESIIYKLEKLQEMIEKELSNKSEEANHESD